MENKPSTNVFQEVHQKIQAAKDKARQAKQTAMDLREKEAETEALREGFDRGATKPPLN